MPPISIIIKIVAGVIGYMSLGRTTTARLYMTGRHIHTSDAGGFYIDDKPFYYSTIQEKFIQSLAHERQLRLRNLARPQLNAKGELM